MKIGILGGGPAGLYFAYLMKKRDPTHEIVVVEQNLACLSVTLRLWGCMFSICSV